MSNVIMLKYTYCNHTRLRMYAVLKPGTPRVLYMQWMAQCECVLRLITTVVMCADVSIPQNLNNTKFIREKIQEPETQTMWVLQVHLHAHLWLKPAFTQTYCMINNLNTTALL